MKTLTFPVHGMTCQMCVKHVTKALQGIAGVTEVQVDLDAAQATMIYDPAQADTAAFKAAVAEAGYEAEL